MEPPHPPSSRQHKPGQPLDILEANATKNGISPSSSSSSVPVPVASPSLSQRRFSPPIPRHTSSGNSNLTLNIVSSPVESTSPSGISTPYLSTTKNHVVRETNKAFKYYEGGRKLINQYHVVKELGRGVHGKVKRAVNTETGETVAIKIIPRFSKKRRLGKLTAQSNDSGRNMREIAILKKIRHPNIVALLEVIDDPELKKIYMVLEYLEIGEVVWRKKGLPHVCDHERKRVCPYINSGSIVDEDDKAFRQQRLQEHLGDLYRIKQEEERIGSHSQDDHGEYWPSMEREINEVSVEDHEDTSSVAMSRDYSTHNFAGLEPGLSLSTSFPSSVAASRATSRTPSRNQSISSLVRHYNTGIMKTMQINEEPVVAKSVVYDPEGSDMESHRGHRNSTLSRPASVLSSFSANDFEPGLVTHDPFADDFSYVPCFTYERARIAFRDTVLGLEYLHYQGIIHRDIKPANLLWTRDRHVKISDFGVSYFGRPIRDGEDEGTLSESEAIDFDDDRELSKTVGTPAFFAPELCYTDPNAAEAYKVSEQIDVWSLGVTLYCLIYARIPFLAEDEYQMFRKIATEEPYLSDIRLAPVDPTTTPTTSSLFQRQNRAPFRDDNDLVYEKVEPELRDLLSRMLTKNPEKRIRLHEIKRHPWVLCDIPNPEVWLEETDPAKPSEGRRIQVDDHELDDAVVPLTFFERARSVVKKTVAKVGKVIHPLGGGERDAKQTRRRAPSSNAGSSVDLRSHLQGSVLPRDGPLGRRRSIRPDEPHPLVNSMSVNSPLSPQSTSSLFDQLASILPEMSTHYNSNAPGMSREQVQEKSLEEPPRRRMSDLRHSASLRSHRNSHSKSKSGHALDRASVISHENALNRPVFDSADDHSDDGLAMHSTSRTRGATHSHVPTVRSQSPIAIAAVHAAALANATAPSSPCRSQHGRTIQSVDLSRSHYTTVSSSKGTNNFLCLTAVDAKHSVPASPKVDTRPITAHRMTPSVPVTPTIPEARESGLSLHGEPATADNLTSHSNSEDEEEDEDEGLFMATSRSRALTGTKSTQSAEASAADMSMSSTDSLADEGQCSKQVSRVNVTAYQSDPSLPALLSGASSVSVDLDNEGDEISTEAISKIYRTTDSMTPPALAKDRTESGVFDVEPSENIIPVQLDQQSHVSHLVSINGPLRTSAGEIQLDNAKNAHSTRGHSMEDEDQADDADDSDSDEGLTLPMRRRSRLPETTYHPRFPPRRRDTNASICSSDTAKKVDCSQ